MTKDEEISELKSRISKKDREISDLQEALAKSQEFIVNIHQSFPLKLFRDYDSSLGKIIPLRPKKGIKSSKGKLIGKNTLKIVSFLKSDKPTKMEIIYFSHINWNYRYQRPHHILSQFAKQGHKIFYITPILDKLENHYELEKITENIYQVELSSSRYFDIYKDKVDFIMLNSLKKSFDQLKNDLNLDPICIVSFPTWEPLVLELKKQYDCKIIYDCVDNVEGFPNVSKERKNEEKNLIKNSDLIIASARSMYEKIHKITKNVCFIPNGADFVHFNEQRSDNLLRIFPRPIAGYFGAIAEWFDTDLVEFVAKARPDVTFIFIGDTYGSNLKRVLSLDNVYFLGERPYSEIPKYLHGFDVCLIPFKLTQLTQDTHPIKIYEYLATGKPVVATKLPEILYLKDLCYIVDGKKEFLEKLNQAIKENDSELRQKRIKFSSENTWEERFREILLEINKIPSLQLERHS
jgi:glycosyltransferase involved in cell wall biosynthesis